MLIRPLVCIQLNSFIFNLSLTSVPRRDRIPTPLACSISFFTLSLPYNLYQIASSKDSNSSKTRSPATKLLYYVNANTQESTSAAATADNYLAHCKVHTDRTLVRQRKRAFAAYTAQSRARAAAIQSARVMPVKEEGGGETQQQRMERKLAKSQRAFQKGRNSRHRPWLPTQKIPRSEDNTVFIVIF